MTKNDGGPAFPFWEPKFAESPKEYIRTGMSIRQWFAGKALEGLLSSDTIRGGFSEIATIAYKYADAMIDKDLQSTQGKEDREKTS